MDSGGKKPILVLLLTEEPNKNKQSFKVKRFYKTLHFVKPGFHFISLKQLGAERNFP